MLIEWSLSNLWKKTLMANPAHSNWMYWMTMFPTHKDWRLIFTSKKPQLEKNIHSFELRSFYSRLASMHSFVEFNCELNLKFCIKCNSANANGDWFNSIYIHSTEILNLLLVKLLNKFFGIIKYEGTKSSFVSPIISQNLQIKKVKVEREKRPEIFHHNCR